ncbi:hypothetical protein D3C75_1219350 [compost metagenome]
MLAKGAGEAQQDSRLHSSRASLLPVVQPLFVAVALQAGLAVVPGQGEHIQRVVVTGFPIFADLLFRANGFTGDLVDQFR